MQLQCIIINKTFKKLSLLLCSRKGDFVANKFKIESKNAVCSNYGGVGGNLWTCDLSDEGIKAIRLTEAYFEINAQRINKVKPKLMRIMIMPQYIVDYSDGKNGYENWINGIYDFNTSYMHNFWRYCEAFKKAGTKIELNMGGAVSTDIVDWYGMGVYDQFGGTRTGPENLDAFALATVSLLKECHRRGYGDTVTFLNFYNESCHLNFGSFGDKRVFWCKMLELVHKELVKQGLRDKVTVIGADADTHAVLGGDVLHQEWLDYIYENAFKKGYCDTLSSHLYFDHQPADGGQVGRFYKIDNMVEYCNQAVKAYPGMKRNLMITEFGRLDHKDAPGVEGGDGNFDRSLVGEVLAQANEGISYSAFWFFHGAYISSPICNFQCGGLQLWETPGYREERGGRMLDINAVNSTFGEMGLLMRYINTDSTVVKSYSDSKDFRIGTFLDGEDTTVVIEVNRGDADRDFEIDLDGRTNKPYYKHIYTFPKDDNMMGKEADSQFDGNAILPVGEKIDVLEGKIKDSVGDGHYLILYTTLPEAKQLVLNSIEVELHKGESFKFEVKQVIGTENAKIKYSVMPDGKTGAVCGEISDDGTYTAPENSKSGDTVAIMVGLDDGRETVSERYTAEDFAVAIVRII